MTVSRGQHWPLDDARDRIAQATLARTVATEARDTIEQTTLARTVATEDRLDLADLVSTSEAARIRHCSPDNIRRLARLGRLRPVVWTGAGRLFLRADVKALADEQKKRGRVEAPAPEAA
jgi:hypothetical protein